MACSFTGSLVAKVDEAQQALRTGRYEDAVRMFTEQIEDQGATVQAYRGLIQALREIGRYEQAEKKVRDYARALPESSELANTLGEILYETGRISAARDAFVRSIAADASDRLTAELNLAVLYFEQGEIDEAMDRFDGFIDVYNRGGRLTSVNLTAVGTACRYLGVDDPQLFKDALRAFDEAAAADPADFEPRFRAGELFLEKYNSPDARESFKEVLAVNPSHPRALLGMARVMQFDGSAEAYDLTKKALEINPNLVPARVFLGRQELDLEDYRNAERQAEKALEVNPASLEALSLLAAARYLSGDLRGFEQAQQDALGRNPRYADFYNMLADTCVRNRLYASALDFARQATELYDKSWWGFGLLGLNQLRLGYIEEGRKNLERSFAGDPYNVWIKNTLDLIDTFADYVESKSSRFVAFVERKESDLIALYGLPLLEEAYDALAARYRYRPPTPIRVEFYPSHADFSVRTIGLAGLGALGVCFGPVVAMDSPSAREKGEFVWASTLWHELTHTVTLGVTDNRVPRWFSEGLSVYEERRARPGWGDDVSIPFLTAYKAGKLLPIADLNNGFVRPSYPHQIVISYYQASLICELIERDYGFEAILDMLAGYKEGMGTEEIFRNVLGCGPECLDRKLDTYLKQRFGTVVAALSDTDEQEGGRSLSAEDLGSRARARPGDFRVQLAMGALLVDEGRLDEAIPYLRRAKELFPEYAGKDSSYWLLAQIYQSKGEPDKAVEELSRLVSLNGQHYDALVQLAELRETAGDTTEAAVALEGAVYVYPFEVSLHRRLADVYRTLGDHPNVIRERKALVAVEVTDRAQVLYELALAYFEAGDPVRARREVLRALEIAPSFDEALNLLVKLQPGEDEESM